MAHGCEAVMTDNLCNHPGTGFRMGGVQLIVYAWHSNMLSYTADLPLLQNAISVPDCRTAL